MLSLFLTNNSHKKEKYLQFDNNQFFVIEKKIEQGPNTGKIKTNLNIFIRNNFYFTKFIQHKLG